MHKLTVTLKQHTPLIHFQHDQEGATLRASEVKPKLDRFILSKLSDDEKNKGKKDGWIKEKDGKCWLDYKMRIRLGGVDSRQEFLLASYMKQDKKAALQRKGIMVIDNTAYFAQEKQNGEISKSYSPVEKWHTIEKKGILHNVSLVLQIQSTSLDFITMIAKQIQSFFLSTNFGTRQSKGFGCFTVTNIVCDNEVKALQNNEELLKQLFPFVYKKTQNQSDVSSVLSQINEDYRLLKSGRRRPYAKSKLMLFEKKRGIRWEKKFIKQDFNDKPIQKENEEDYILKSDHNFDYEKDDVEFEYIRAVLGVAEQYEFLLDNPPLRNSKMVVKIKNDDIDRYQSPLLFKVIGSSIYILGRGVDNHILNQSFDFSISIPDDDVAWSGSIGELSTPKEFSLKEFIKFAMNDKTNNAQLGYIALKQ